MIFFVFMQKTAYEMRISDWSSDVCSSDLHLRSCFDLPARHLLSVFDARHRFHIMDLTEALRAEEFLGRVLRRRADRSEEGGVGKERVGTGRFRWTPDP